MKPETDDRYESRFNIIKKDAEALNEFTQNIRDQDHLVLIRYFDWVRRLHDLMQETKKLYDAIHDALSREYVPDAMRRAGVKTVNVIDVGRVTISHRFSCSMIDKEKGMEWLRANGLDGIIIETVNAATLGATAKDLLENHGRDLPGDLFKTSTSAFTSITKSK